MRLTFFAATDTGKKRTHNEDYYITPKSDNNLNVSGDNSLFILCDGMGGRNAGEVASQFAAKWLQQEYEQLKTDDSDRLPINEVMNNLIQKVHQRIYQLAKEHEEYEGMGTTLVSALFRKNELVVNSIGDSRCYRLREGCFEQLTEDHSDVWKLYKIGAIAKEEMSQHPRSNVITMAVGVSSNLEINSYLFDFQANDLYLLCSDGLTDMIDDNSIVKILQDNNTLHSMAEELIKAANEGGGKDNITVILAKVEQRDEPSPKSSSKPQPKKQRKRFGFFLIPFLFLIALGIIATFVYRNKQDKLTDNQSIANSSRTENTTTNNYETDDERL